MANDSQRGIIALLFVGVLMGALDISIVGPAIPSIEEALRINSHQSGWIFSIYVLFNLIGISLFARLSDVFGRRNIYILALAIFAAGSLVVSMAGNFDLIMVGRAVQGLGASGIFPVASALVGDLFPLEKRGRILGLIGAVFGIAFLVGPFIAGILLKYFSWNVLFIINLPVALVLIFYSYRLLPSVSTLGFRDIDWPGIILLGGGLAVLTLGLNNIVSFRISSVVNFFETLLPFLIFAATIIALYLFERRAKNPIIKFGFFMNYQVLIVGLIASVTGIMQACFVFIPKFVVLIFSVDPSAASFMLIPIVLATAIGSPVFGRMIDKYGVKIIVIIGLVLSASGFFMLSLFAEIKTLYYLSGALIGLGLSVLAGSSLRYIMLKNTIVEDRATSQGMLTIFTSVGQLFGAAFIGLILLSQPDKKGFEMIFAGVSALILVMFFLSFGIKGEKGN